MCIPGPAAAAPRRGAISIFWRVVAVNVAVLGTSALLLIVTPIRITPRIAAAEAAIVIAGFVVLTAISLLLLRGVLSPLRRLAATMDLIELRTPGRRLDEREGRYAEVLSVVRAFNAMLDRLEEERRTSSRRVLEAQEAERVRIARELHDDIGQTLTAIAMEAERAAGADDDPRSQALRRAASAVRASLDDLRRIARELRPEALDDLGLANALISLGRRVQQQSGVEVSVRVAEGLAPLASETEVAVYRVAQESLTNAIRHSGARRVEVTLAPDGPWTVLTVRDDGVGLRGSIESGTGVTGMRERALLVDGRLALRSEPGRGTVVELRVPGGSP